MLKIHSLHWTWEKNTYKMKLILLLKGFWCAKCEGMPEVNGKTCENTGADIKAPSANLERCVSMELLHHHIQQLA